MPYCSATTAQGRDCRRWAVQGSTLCASHLGRTARPTLLTDDVAELIVSMLRAGNYMHVAAVAAGITRQTLDDWLRRGRSDAAIDAPYRRLREQVAKARAEGEARNVARIAKAATTSWQAAAWMLERSYPERWGRPAVALRSTEPPPPAPVEPEQLDPFAEVDELAELRRRHAGE